MEEFLVGFLIVRGFIVLFLYFPGVIPSEKYSPLLLVFRLYFWPLSRLSYSTTPPTIGLPSDLCGNGPDGFSPLAQK